ncbi:MAG: hypothetical protein ABIH38_04840 [Patescibacteria group bacterium]
MRRKNIIILVIVIVVFVTLSVLLLIRQYNINNQKRTPETYTACGCGCCGGETAKKKCLWHFLGNDLKKIIEEDKKAELNPNCASMGCSLGYEYKYCD